MSAVQISTENFPDTKSLGTGDHLRPVSQNLRNAVRSVKRIRPKTGRLVHKVTGHQSSLGVRSMLHFIHRQIPRVCDRHGQGLSSSYHHLPVLDPGFSLFPPSLDPSQKHVW